MGSSPLWRHRYADHGLEGLQSKPLPGKQPIYTKATDKRILKLLDKSPPAGYARWTGPLLAGELGDVDVQYVWRFLRSNKIDLAARKSWCESNDPQFTAKSALDYDTLCYIVWRSVDHESAQASIACGYVEILAPYLGACFDLGLSAFPTRYCRGEVMGVLETRYPLPALIAKVEGILERRCGTNPNLANPDDGIPVLEWLTWCIEVMKSGDPGHVPGDDVQREIAAMYQKCGATKRIIGSMLDEKKVQSFLKRPVDTILERVLAGDEFGAAHHVHRQSEVGCTSALVTATNVTADMDP